MRSLLFLFILFCCGNAQAFFVHSYSIQPEVPTSGEEIHLSIRVCSGGTPVFSEYFPTFDQNAVRLMFLTPGIALSVPGCEDVEVQLPPGVPGPYTIAIGLNNEIVDTFAFQVHGLEGPGESIQTIPASSTVAIIVLFCVVLLFGLKAFRLDQITPHIRR